MNENGQKSNESGWAGPALFTVVAIGLAILFWWFLSA